MGNPKQTKNMLLAHKTPPTTVTGIRDSAEISVRSGIKHIQFAVRPDEYAVAIDEYLKSLKSVPSPYLVKGRLSEKAKRGRKVFEAASCGSCHSGKLLTDMKLHDLGMAKGVDAGRSFDTPTLVEIWRTAPYLYDGRAATMQEVLTTHNKDDRHGDTSGLTEKELEDLNEYILSQ
jgi:cytochrome c peroxidase